jgi:hypothetical protein
MGNLPNLPDVRKLSASERVAAGIALVALVTILLWLTGVVASAATLTAYSTLLLAGGTTGLAWGAIGTYVEQRRQGLEQQKQIAAQQHQLEIAWENDIAQVTVKRISGPGEVLQIKVINNSSRAIRSVYVWAVVQGMSPHYETVLQDTDSQTGQLRMSRRMQTARIMVDSGELYRSYRAMQPGHSETFVQFRSDELGPVPDVSNAWITAYAMFSDIKGAWWKCSEDGDVEPVPDGPVPVIENRPVMGTGIPATRPIPGVKREALHRRQAGKLEQPPGGQPLP